MLWRKSPRDIAKVGVEGSNPFARSKFPQYNQATKSGPSGPFLLREALSPTNRSALYALERKSPDIMARIRRRHARIHHARAVSILAEPEMTDDARPRWSCTGAVDRRNVDIEPDKGAIGRALLAPAPEPPAAPSSRRRHRSQRREGRHESCSLNALSGPIVHFEPERLTPGGV